GVDPEVAVDRGAGIHGRDDLEHDVAGRQPDARGLLSVNVQDEVGGVRPLGDVDVGRPTDADGAEADFAGQLHRLLRRTAGDFDVDGRRGAVVQGRRDHPAGVEVDPQVVETLVDGGGVPQPDRVLLRA